MKDNKPAKPSAKKKPKAKPISELQVARLAGPFFAFEPRLMSDGAALVTGAEVIKDTTTTDQSTIPASDGNNSPDSTNADSSDNDALWSPGLSLAWRNFDPIVVLDMNKQGRERWARKMMEAENAEARELQRFNQIFETKTGTPSPPSSSTHPRSL